MIPRLLASEFEKLLSWFPVVSVTGPRQSGKSTLVRMELPDYGYVNLEDPQLRKEALEDPVGFIRNRPSRLIVDEAQYTPDLFSVIQAVSDERGSAGQYVLSGSQNFLLAKGIGQSLAGRVGMLKLLPLSYVELSGQPYGDVDEFMVLGGYPRMRATGMPAELFFPNYIDTYIERDVAGYLDVRNLAAFRRFLSLCALNAGNLVNYAGMARDVDVDVRTVKSWLSMLEASYVVYLLPPYYSNKGKRLVKSPKLYFCDTGLLCNLLGIASVDLLNSSEHLGAVVENLVVAETLKAHLNRGERPELYFYRNDSRVEVDLLDFTKQGCRKMIEVKSGRTYRDNWARHLTSVGDALGIDKENRVVACRVEHSFVAKGAQVACLHDWLLSA